MAKMGFGRDRLDALNPGIVSASVTGFGSTGPYAQRPAFDFITQAMSGLLSVNGTPDQPLRSAHADQRPAGRPLRRVRHRRRTPGARPNRPGTACRDGPVHRDAVDPGLSFGRVTSPRAGCRSGPATTIRWSRLRPLCLRRRRDRDRAEQTTRCRTNASGGAGRAGSAGHDTALRTRTPAMAGGSEAQDDPWSLAWPADRRAIWIRFDVNAAAIPCGRLMDLARCPRSADAGGGHVDRGAGPGSGGTIRTTGDPVKFPNPLPERRGRLPELEEHSPATSPGLGSGPKAYSPKGAAPASSDAGAIPDGGPHQRPNQQGEDTRRVGNRKLMLGPGWAGRAGGSGPRPHANAQERNAQSARPTPAAAGTHLPLDRPPVDRTGGRRPAGSGGELSPAASAARRLCPCRFERADDVRP